MPTHIVVIEDIAYNKSLIEADIACLADAIQVVKEEVAKRGLTASRSVLMGHREAAPVFFYYYVKEQGEQPQLPRYYFGKEITLNQLLEQRSTHAESLAIGMSLDGYERCVRTYRGTLYLREQDVVLSLSSILGADKEEEGE